VRAKAGSIIYSVLLDAGIAFTAMMMIDACKYRFTSTAILTRLRSPPDIPRIKALPTRLFLIWANPNCWIISSTRCAL
jgi:hypothetical protein